MCSTIGKRPGPLGRQRTSVFRPQAPLGGQTRRPSRRGAIIIELLLALPLFVIAVLAIVQFGVFFANMQQATLACRVGAEEASQTTPLPNQGDVPGDPVPTAIVNAVVHQMAAAGLSPCAIILEHNINGGVEQTLRTDFDRDNDNNDDCPDCREPATLIPPRTVRITVCVRLDEVMPNCLASFGLDISDDTTRCATTFAYEL